MLGSLSQDLITDTTGAEQAWVIFGETWIPSATCLPSELKAMKQLEKLVWDNRCSCYKHRAWAVTTQTSPRDAEVASPLAKCLVLHGSCTILVLNGSSILQTDKRLQSQQQVVLRFPFFTAAPEGKGGKARQTECSCRTDTAQKAPR